MTGSSRIEPENSGCGKEFREKISKTRFDSRNSVLEWSILLIDNSNGRGSMEFVVPRTDSSAFFPISVQFSALYIQ
ncbi:coatomer subunit delta-like [Pistacia vera]|uniref:coatomer subunit delta-like n=1 Tax=Pistacia vera TaxID=55513 RepID=UPI0012635AC5|nr:coatomer subunit delta-like [Pistacia vera]